MPKYHMKKKEREIKDKAVFKTVLKHGKYTTIALCRKQEPYIVTLNYGYDEAKHAMYFHCAPEGLKIEFIEANPRVCATVIEDRGYQMGECEHAYRSVIIWGKMFVIHDLDEKKTALNVMIQQLEDQPDVVRERTFKDENRVKNVGILRLDIEEITGKQGE